MLIVVNNLVKWCSMKFEQGRFQNNLSCSSQMTRLLMLPVSSSSQFVIFNLDLEKI